MTNKLAAIVYPHQLWEVHPAVSAAKVVVLVEDPLFFTQYQFHAQKLVLHRASMTEFTERCERLGKQVHRIESKSISHSSAIGAILQSKKIKNVVMVEPTDEWLKQRVAAGCLNAEVDLKWMEDRSFLTPTDVMQRWAEVRKHYHFTDFYMQQRKRLKLLLDEKGKPVGDFEDAISKEETFLFHGVLTPMLNVGLLTPEQIIRLVVARSGEVSLNSLEGFVRQVIGWREFIRLVYIHAGSQQRTTNAWNLSRRLPTSFYTGSTGIIPFDQSIQRTLKFAYCHHIERLMVLGNFMLLCDSAPNAVYQWFMEMFIDSYDWVMVPNVYGMSQHADGGLMTTKPYISGSSYILKMSDYSKGDWCEVWDALYWRFIDREREFFSANPRMRVMVGQLDRMGTKLDHHRMVADRFLVKLHG